MAARDHGVPAASVYADGATVARLRRLLRERRRARAHGHLLGGRGAPARRVGPADPARRARRAPFTARDVPAATRRRGRARPRSRPSRRCRAHLGRGRPHDRARRVAAAGIVKSARADLDRMAEELSARLPGAVTRDVPFAELSTYRVGGPVGVLARVSDSEALAAVADSLRRWRPKLLVVGRGSNLLMS